MLGAQGVTTNRLLYTLLLFDSSSICLVAVPEQIPPSVEMGSRTKPEQSMMVLANLEAMHIRTSYYSKLDHVRFSACSIMPPSFVVV
jgi:hypothetical protein